MITARRVICVVFAVVCAMASASRAQVLINEDFSTDPTLAGHPGGQWTYCGGHYLTSAYTGSGTWWTAGSQYATAYTQWNKINSPYFTATPFDYYKVTYDSLSNATSAATAVNTNQIAMGWAADPSMTAGSPPRPWGLWDIGGATEESRPYEMTANVTAIPNSASWATHSFYVRAPENAAQGYVRIQAADVGNVSIDNVRVEHVTNPSDVVAFADSVYATIPALNYSPDPARTTYLTRTLDKLQSHQTTRIAMFGDSLMNDAGNSSLDVLLERFYNTRVEVVNAIGSGTGMSAWNSPATCTDKSLNFDGSITAQHPDLVIIGGISDGANTTSYDAIRAMIDKVKAALPDAEIMLTTGPDYDPSSGEGGDIATQFNDVLKANWSYAPTTAYRSSLLSIANEKDVAFMDLRGVWGQYLRDAVNLNGYDTTTLKTFFRDSNHTSTTGEEVLGRALATYLEVPEPTSLAWLLVPLLALKRRRR